MSLAKFIENIPNDKKGHLILGLTINPVLFVLSILFLNSSFLGLIFCLGIHSFIEVYQMITKTGKGDVLDFLAGSYSAIIIYIIINLI